MYVRSLSCMSTCIRFPVGFILVWFAGLATAHAGHPQSRVDPKHSVTIYRDNWGVPHIYAEREEDGFYGLGYAQAQDRLPGLNKSSSFFVRGLSLMTDLHTADH
jgi:acyl-homoserine lactone acylase PvdQ